jgi:hybrid cluster-associated redox disulfide protein
VTRGLLKVGLRLPVTVEYPGSVGSRPWKGEAIFTKDMSLMEALQAEPRAREVFAAHGMGCVGCMGVSMESIEDGAKMHGIDPEVVLADLNKLAALREEQAE